MIRKSSIKKELIYTIIIAFILQNFVFYLGVGDIGNGVMDFYILNVPYRNIMNIIVLFMLPIYISIISSGYFCKYRPAINYIFTRESKRKFISKDLMYLVTKNFLMTLLLFAMCFVFLMVFYVIVDPSMLFTTTIDLSQFSGVLSPNLYFNQPILYLIGYAGLFSLASIVCTMIGYLASLYVTNKYIVNIAPFLIVVVLALVFDAIPIFAVKTVSFLQLLQLAPQYSLQYSALGGLVIYIGILSILIVKKVRHDIL